uniref:Uncharacterized protein n=1 Tax=viral metagenome TaxID=1070528 RepID=A0A6C0LXC5_9ZZZZ
MIFGYDFQEEGMGVTLSVPESPTVIREDGGAGTGHCG